MEAVGTFRDSLPAMALASAPQLFSYCTIAVAFYVLLVIVYRLRFHPLAKYPGPLRYKLSNWPIVYQAYKGNRHLHHLRDHQIYGSIVRIGPSSLSFRTETALNTIYGSKTVNVQKSEFYKTLDSGAGAFSTHTELDKEKHAVRRRLLSHAFSDGALRSAEHFILENITKWCSLLGPSERAEWSETRNMSVWSNWLGYDVMGDLAFGKRFKCLESEENRYVPTALTEGTKFGYWFSYVPGVWVLRPFVTSRFMQWVGGRAAKDNAVLVNYAIEQCILRVRAEEEAKRQGKQMRKDFMHYLLDSQDSKTKPRLTEAELRADSLLLIGAGADTVSTSIAASFFYLLRNPTALDKATTEVRKMFSDASEIRSGAKLNSCEYLQACLEETLRCASPVSSVLPREVLSGGIDIDGHYIPSGTIVGVPAYVIHHDPRYFPDPWSFKPERWIADEKAGVTRKSVALAYRAFCPFSLGSRGCIGKGLAYMECKLALAHTLFRYDIREASDERGRVGGGSPNLEKGRDRADEYQLFDCFGADRDGPLVKLRSAVAS